MENPFQKGDRVSQGPYVGVVVRVAFGVVRVRWHRDFLSSEPAESLSFADPQPLDRLEYLEEFIAKASENA